MIRKKESSTAFPLPVVLKFLLVAHRVHFIAVRDAGEACQLCKIRAPESSGKQKQDASGT